MKRFEYKYSDLQYPVRMNNDCSNLFMPYDNYPGYQQGLVLDLPLSKVVEYIDVPFIEKYEGEITIEKMENYITYGTRKAKSFVYFCNMGTLGSEGGDGTAENPWASVGYALKKLKPLVDCVYFNYCGQVYITLRCSGTTSDIVCCYEKIDDDGRVWCDNFNGRNIFVLENGRINKKRDKQHIDAQYGCRGGNMGWINFAADSINDCIFKNFFFDLDYSMSYVNGETQPEGCSTGFLHGTDFFWNCEIYCHGEIYNNREDFWVSECFSYFLDCNIVFDSKANSREYQGWSGCDVYLWGVFCKCDIRAKVVCTSSNFADVEVSFICETSYCVDCVVDVKCSGVSKDSRTYSTASGCFEDGWVDVVFGTPAYLIRTDVKLDMTAVAPDELTGGYHCNSYAPSARIRGGGVDNYKPSVWYKSNITLTCYSSRRMYTICFVGEDEDKLIYGCTIPKNRCESVDGEYECEC